MLSEAAEGLVRRIGTLNCGHAAFPIILGVSSPQYSPEELEKLRADNAKGVTVNGKHYTMYKATQRQRELERAIRRQKWRIAADEGAGDSEQLQTDRVKLAMLNREYKQFSKAAGLREQSDRTVAAVFGKEQSGQYEPVARTFNQYMTLEGLKLTDGTTIHVSEHVVERAVTRNVSVSAAKNALQNPLDRTKIKYDKDGRPSYKLIGEKATVAINPETGVIASIWPTRTKKAEKLKERQKP